MAQHEYRARIHWERGAAAFTDNRFSRAHRWHFDGGIELEECFIANSVTTEVSCEPVWDG